MQWSLAHLIPVPSLPHHTWSFITRPLGLGYINLAFLLSIGIADDTSCLHSGATGDRAITPVTKTPFRALHHRTLADIRRLCLIGTGMYRVSTGDVTILCTLAATDSTLRPLTSWPSRTLPYQTTLFFFGAGDSCTRLDGANNFALFHPLATRCWTRTPVSHSPTRTLLWNDMHKFVWQNYQQLIPISILQRAWTWTKRMKHLSICNERNEVPFAYMIAP